MSKENKYIELKRSGVRKDTFDCIIRLEQISPQLLLALGEQIKELINAQLKNYEGLVKITPNTFTQLNDISRLIRLREEILAEFVKK